MKHLFIIALSQVCAYAYAQTEVAKPASNSTGFKRLYVGISTTQGVGYRLLKHNYDARLADEAGFIYGIENRNKIEVPSYNYNVGIKLGINVTNFLSFETGVDYARKGYEAKQDRYGYFMTTGFGWPPGPRERADGMLNVHAVYHYIDLPVAAKFTIGRGKLKGIVSTGVYFNLLLNKKTRTTYKHNGEPKVYVEDGNRYTKSFNVSPFLGAGISYNISSSLNLYVMPVVQFQALNNRNKLFSSMEYLYGGGINVALNFSFADMTAKAKK